MDLTRVSRRKAFLIHLALSLLIFATLIALMVVQWFPGALFTVDGGWQGIRIIAAVDIVLGPLLTLMLFRPEKKKHRTLLFDLGLIAMVQVAALSWGVWTVYSQRTVALVFYVDRFYSMVQPSLDKADALLLNASLQPRDPAAISDETPPLVFVREFSGEARKQYFDALFTGRLPLAYQRSDLYEPLPFDEQALIGEQLQAEYLDGLERLNPPLSAKLQAALDEHSGPASAPPVFLLEARYSNAFILLEPRGTGKILAIVPFSEAPPAAADKTQ